MKKLLLAALLLGTSVLAHNSHHNNRNDHNNRYGKVHYQKNHHNKRKQHFVKVSHSRPMYENVVTYRVCRPQHRDHRIDRHNGAIVGGVIGGLIGNRVATKHKPLHTVGGAVTGAIIGTQLTRHQLRPSKRCKHVEKRLTGYKNIAYWHGKKIVRISDRPLRKIRIERKQHSRGYAKRY